MSVDEAYDRWAGQYDTNENPTRDLDRKATREVLSGVSFSRVLELGCGTGKNTAWFAERAESVIGLDFSMEMLNKAASKIDLSHVAFRQTDLTRTWDVVDDDSFDLVSCNLTLEHIGDLDFIFGQASTKLIEGGIFFISELHPYKQYQGSVARFEKPDGTTEYLEAYVHHLTDYTESAQANAFSLVKLDEWFDDSDDEEVPRLITFVFRNNSV